MLIAFALLLGTPFFVFFGWLSDKIGRKPIMLAGCAARGADLFPAVRALIAGGQSGARRGPGNAPVMVTADPATCSVQFDPIGKTRLHPPCDIVQVARSPRADALRPDAGARRSPLDGDVNGRRRAASTAMARLGSSSTRPSAAGYPKAGDLILKQPAIRRAADRGERHAAGRRILFMLVL